MAKLRWALVGCGDIAKKRVAPALRDLENCDFVAVTRARSELARAFAEQFGAGKSCDSLNVLLADEEIQAVYVATPVYLHAEHTVAAAGVLSSDRTLYMKFVRRAHLPDADVASTFNEHLCCSICLKMHIRPTTTPGICINLKASSATIVF